MSLCCKCVNIESLIWPCFPFYKRLHSSSVPSTPITAIPNVFCVLKSCPTKSNRSREDIILKRKGINERKRHAEDVWDHIRKPREDEDKRRKDGQPLIDCKICNERWSTAITTISIFPLQTGDDDNLSQKCIQHYYDRDENL